MESFLYIYKLSQHIGMNNYKLLSLFLLAKCKIAETLLKHTRIKQKSHTKEETGGVSVHHKMSEQVIGQQTLNIRAI